MIKVASAAVSALALILSTCGNSSQGSPPPYPFKYQLYTKTGYALRCTVPARYYVAQKDVPASYSISALGKPGVPSLTPSERRAIEKVALAVHSSTLRFAILPHHHFIVYDAVNGPCGSTLIYNVLNGSCGEHYQPVDAPTATRPAPDCLLPNDLPRR